MVWGLEKSGKWKVESGKLEKVYGLGFAKSTKRKEHIE